MLEGMLTPEQKEILNGITPGREALGTGSTESELRAKFPNAAVLLPQLEREGYVEVVQIDLAETAPPSPPTRVCHRTDKAEAELLED
jgi:hypothetical protein